MDGLLVIDKPRGPTSHDVVVRMRRALAERRIGHTGTLDPLATGVLPLVLGRATRLARFLSAGEKIYDVEIRLGVATDTYDADGSPAGARYEGPWPSRDEVARTLHSFVGDVSQQPPAFSAKKIDGRRSHRIARSGAVDGAARPRPAAVPVTAHAVDLLDMRDDCVSVRIRCSAGFYVRSLAHDLGRYLGVGAHVAGLRRTRSGDVSLSDAMPLEAAEANPASAHEAIVPLDRMLLTVPSVVLTEAGAKRAQHGCDLAAPDVASQDGTASGVVRLLDHSGHFFGIAESSKTSGLLHPSVILM